eukprot:scaffold131736_cov62-Attheya_sp.AAC.1
MAYNMCTACMTVLQRNSGVVGINLGACARGPSETDVSVISTWQMTRRWIMKRMMKSSVMRMRRDHGNRSDDG